ncbi:P-loop NTPase fold protein [Cronobacter dublinensis]
MSLESTKKQLEQLLIDKDNKVISLSGKWGTGKSFMWDQVKTSSADETIKGALYASLFGLSGMDQVKMKLLQSAVPAIEANPGFWESAKQTVSSGVKVLEGFHKGFGALNDLGLVFAPAILRQKLIVLDDIERKHEKLNIDELLGFIDEFTQQHHCRFMLILNSDQLARRDIWDILREKVIDQELKLTTSASEAFEVAVSLTPSIYAAQIRTAVITCGLTNIRIIRKIIKVVNRILENRKDLTESVLWRVIPSTVLLSSIHYKGLEDGPDFDFVLTHNSIGNWDVLSDKKKEVTEESKQQSKWKLLISQLRISQCDDFELLVVEFLQSGLFDVSELSKIISRYIKEADESNARFAVHKFMERSFWDHTLKEEELIAEAIALSDKTHLLDAQTVSSLCEVLSELPNGEVVIDDILSQWISFFQTRNLGDTEYSYFFRYKLHPKILAEFENTKEKIQQKTTVYEACRSIAEHNGWGSRQEIAFKSSTVQDMEDIIRKSEISELRFFMSKMIDLCINKEMYEQYFGSAMDNFIQACRNIIEDPQAVRLGKLIKKLFANTELKNLFEGDQNAEDVIPSSID